MKRLLAMLLTLALALSVASGACALTLRKGSTGSTVKALQEALNAAGYGPLKVDAKYGTQTVEAVRGYQRDKGLKVDGVAGPDTLAALGVTSLDREDVTLRPGMSGAAVSDLQDTLALYGYPVGATDGKYGAQTTRAVRLFQKLNGLKVDGVAGKATLTLLESGSCVPYEGEDSGLDEDGDKVITACVISNLIPVVGDTVTAAVIPAGGTATYTWYRDGVKAGSGSSYQVTALDLGCVLSVSAEGYNDTSGSAYSSKTQPVVEAVGGDRVLTGTALIKNRAAAESTLGVTAALNTDQVHYKWFLNGTLYAQTRTITLTSDMIGSYVHVLLEAVDGSGYYGSVMSNLCYVTARAPDVPVENIDNNPLAFEGTAVLPESVTHGSVLTSRIDVNCPRYTMAWYVDGAYYANTRVLQITDDIPSGAAIVLKLVPNTDSGYRGMVETNPCIVSE